MNEMERKFLDDIAASPADPAPQLLFADWLEEQGRDQEAEHYRNIDPRSLYTKVVDDVPGFSETIESARHRLRSHHDAEHA